MDQVSSVAELAFLVETEPTSVPVPAGDLGVDGAFTNDTTPLLEWERSTDNVTAAEGITYDVEIDVSEAFIDPFRIITGGVSWDVVEFELPMNQALLWRVRSRRPRLRGLQLRTISTIGPGR